MGAGFAKWRIFMAKRLIIAVGVALLAGSQGAIAQETEATIRAYAAGYKAAFTCSATFNGGKGLDQIAAHELTGIYPLVADIVPTLEAKIDRNEMRVSVKYRDDMPPRISQWRKHFGCVQLPVGADVDDVEAVFTTHVQAKVKSKIDNGAPWQTLAPINGTSGNTALDDVIDRAFTKAYGKGARTSAVLITTPDAILVERYIDGFGPTTSQRTWSVAKSIGASVIGAAVQKGLFDVKAPAGLENWSKPLDPRGKITVENLLHMASGLDSNRAGNRTDRLYLGGGLVSDTATESALEVKPGSRWKYANNDTLLAVRALRETFEDPHEFQRFAFEKLLYRIGMTHTKLETDWDGNFILSSQVWTTSRDLARLGVLHLNDGVWYGQRYLPKGWLDYISTPAPAQPPEKSASGARIPGYGAQWWLYNERFPELPNDTIAARGNRGQFLMLIPSRNLVIVRRGYDMAGEKGFQLHEFARDVLAAMD